MPGVDPVEAPPATDAERQGRHRLAAMGADSTAVGIEGRFAARDRLVRSHRIALERPVLGWHSTIVACPLIVTALIIKA